MIDLCALSSYIHDFSEKKHSSLIASVPGANCRTTAVPFYVTGGIKKVLIITGVIRFYDEWDLFFS